MLEIPYLEVTNRSYLSSRAPPHARSSIYARNREIDISIIMRFIGEHPDWRWTWKIAVSKRTWPSERTRHANHPGPSPSVQQKITPHIPWKKIGLPFSNFPSFFFKVADLRFNTFLDTYGTIRQCCRSPRPLEMLPIDYPSNSTPDGTFAPHFRKRSSAKIQKSNKKKIFSVTIWIQAGKKSATWIGFL